MDKHCVVGEIMLGGFINLDQLTDGCLHSDCRWKQIKITYCIMILYAFFYLVTKPVNL